MEAELEQARRYLLGQMTVMLDSTAGLMSWLGESVMQYGDIVFPEQARELILSVTRDEVNEMARLVFLDNRPSLSVVGPRWAPEF